MPARLPAAMKRLACGLAGALVVVGSMGASCTPRVGNPFDFGSPTAPVVLGPTATAADVVAAVNANASRVQTYSAPNASIATPDSAGIALVSASIAIERPTRFRMRATTAISGPEIDLGSNDQRFWIWARRSDPPALYTARHDLWRTSPARRQMPIEPSWLIDALGLTLLDPAATYLGPTPKGDGAIELASQLVSPDGGAQRRVLLIDAQTAQVREQHLYDTDGTLIASVLADRFRYDSVTGVSLPERVRVQAPSSGLELTINTGPVVLNAPLGDPAGLWTPPQLPGTPIVDLTPTDGAPLAANGSAAWDLAGVSSAYPSTPITTPMGSTAAPAASPAPADMWAPPTAGENGRSAATPAPSAGFSPAKVTPLPASSNTNGFTRLPPSGRAL